MTGLRGTEGSTFKPNTTASPKDKNPPNTTVNKPASGTLAGQSVTNSDPNAQITSASKYEAPKDSTNLKNRNAEKKEARMKRRKALKGASNAAKEKAKNNPLPAQPSSSLIPAAPPLSAVVPPPPPPPAPPPPPIGSVPASTQSGQAKTWNTRTQSTKALAAQEKIRKKINKSAGGGGGSQAIFAQIKDLKDNKSRSDKAKPMSGAEAAQKQSQSGDHEQNYLALKKASETGKAKTTENSVEKTQQPVDFTVNVDFLAHKIQKKLNLPNKTIELMLNYGFNGEEASVDNYIQVLGERFFFEPLAYYLKQQLLNIMQNNQTRIGKQFIENFNELVTAYNPTESQHFIAKQFTSFRDIEKAVTSNKAEGYHYLIGKFTALKERFIDEEIEKISSKCITSKIENGVISGEISSPKKLYDEYSKICGQMGLHVAKTPAIALYFTGEQESSFKDIKFGDVTNKDQLEFKVPFNQIPFDDFLKAETYEAILRGTYKLLSAEDATISRGVDLAIKQLKGDGNSEFAIQKINELIKTFQSHQAQSKE